MGSVLIRYLTSEGVQESILPLQGESTVGDLMRRLATEASGGLQTGSKKVLEGSSAGFVVVVNGMAIHSRQGLRTPVADGDTVSIMPLVVGG